MLGNWENLEYLVYTYYPLSSSFEILFILVCTCVCVGGVVSCVHMKEEKRACCFSSTFAWVPVMELG